jgi:outer membrane receptor for ferrienterochelin and colicin
VRSDNFDLGVRFGTPDFAVSLQGYYVELKNNIGIVPVAAGSAADIDDIIRGNSATKAANLSGITTKGVEITVFKDLGQVDFYGSYAYQKAEHNDARSAAEAVGLAQNGIIGGAAARDIPEHSAYFRLGWKIRDGLRVSASANYVGERVGGHIIAPPFANPSNSFDAAGNPVGANQPIGTQMLPSHTLFGLNLQYQPRTGTFWDRCIFLLTADNVFDKDYIGAVSSATATLPEFGVVGGAGFTLDRYFIGAPRTVTFSVSTRF